MTAIPPDQSPAPHTTVATLAEELRLALPVERIESLSIHDRQGDPVWMSGGLIGPDEHSVALDAITVFEVEGHRNHAIEKLSDELSAVLLPIASVRSELHGVAMLITPTRALPAPIENKLVSSKLRSILQRLGVVMKPQPANGNRRGTTAARGLPKPRPNPFPVIEEIPIESVPAAAATGRHAALKSQPVRDISLHVQQLMKLRSGGRTRRYEVLVRGRNSETGDAMDESLIKALSVTETAAAIDRLVVAQLARWLKDHPTVWNADPASFSINLSLGSLLDPAFARFFSQCLQSSGVAPDTIGFEIPESAMLRHREAVARFIVHCEQVGCYVVIDDFTMHQDVVPFLSSRALRVIKIDSNLTNAAMTDRLAQAMVIAISQASKVLGLHCVAKRIDTTAARQWLAAVGIDFAQGYLLEDPRPIDTLANGAMPATRSSGSDRPVVGT